MGRHRRARGRPPTILASSSTTHTERTPCLPTACRGCPTDSRYTPIGIFRSVERPSYDRLMADQIAAAPEARATTISTQCLPEPTPGLSPSPARLIRKVSPIRPTLKDRTILRSADLHQVGGRPVAALQKALPERKVAGQCPGCYAGRTFPSEVTALVGRRRELDTAIAQLADSRLVTLVGSGGVGKSQPGRRVGPKVEARFRGRCLARRTRRTHQVANSWPSPSCTCSRPTTWVSRKTTSSDSSVTSNCY